MKKRVFSHALLMAIVLGHAALATADPADDMATRFIASEVQRLGGDEYEGARQVKRSGAGGNGLISFAVLYTIEGIGGGNNYSQYLVAFLNGAGAATVTRPVLVGGKLYRAVRLDHVEPQRIVLETKDYANADAACCPSLNGRSWYWLAEGALTEGPELRRAP